jgi:TatA/E family protein of Tat protein translocase
MFSVGTQEVLIILFVVLMLFGGKRIPEVARALGKGMGDFRRAVRDVQHEIDLEMMKDPPRDGERKLSRPAAKPKGRGATTGSGRDPGKDERSG